MKKLLLFLFLSISMHRITAQTTTCTVLTDSLKGTYEGGCKNGRAHGQGKAVGINSYEGDFKNGLPEGKGKYTWSNGNYYYGSWKKGLKEGKGEFHRFENGVETRIAGYWRDDNYRGDYEHPYVIQNTTTDIGNVRVSKLSNTDKSVSISVTGLVSSTSFGSSFGSRTTMTSFFVTRGSYISKASNTLTDKDITVFQGVVFPFRGTFYFGNSILEIEFFEEGGWDVVVPVNK